MRIVYDNPVLEVRSMTETKNKDVKKMFFEKKQILLLKKNVYWGIMPLTLKILYAFLYVSILVVGITSACN